ncbi:asparaginase [Prochlorococcus sp. MIT 1300]|uniref:asparaginase n=1 Tax=Prochlorococcus sp. MIT 1300 TaxID=3096218 RepID=UPI002A74EBD6|nr:asparaginase [Prochlorococcus sp. MIT 1300]
MNIQAGLDISKRNIIAPLKVVLKRSGSIESVHRVHAVVSDEKGRILMRAGNAHLETFIRSSLKPFQVLPLISSGASEKFNYGEKAIAICCASHNGSPLHAREAFKVLWNADIDVDFLQCPTPVGRKSPLEHNCSGKHAGFLATCKKMNWPLETYLKGNHPLQVEVFRRVAELLGLPPEELLAARDDCGAPTLRLELSQMAMLYAHLGSSKQAQIEAISRAMVSNPELIAGIKRFDTELMLRAHRQVVSKGGAEGIQCISRLSDGIGLAIKVEDGSARAKRAVALHLLRQLEWLTPTGLQELEEQVLVINPGVELEVQGELKFLES